MGLKFQKISVQSVSSESELSSVGNSTSDTGMVSIKEIFNDNLFNKRLNSNGYYFNIGGIIDKKKRYELILEINGTLNKPYLGNTEFYHNNILVEKSNYKTNMLVTVIKIRRWIR